jgi:predicted RND superfamily exporter protein
LTFIPAAVSMMRSTSLSKAHSSGGDYSRWLNGLLHHVTALVLFKRRAILVAALALTALFGAGLNWLRINTDYLGIFSRSSETAQSAEKLHQRLAGAAVVNVVLTGASGSALEPEFLSLLSSLEFYALRQRGVDYAISIADIIGRLSSDGSAAVPESRQENERIFNDFISQEEGSKRLVSADRSKAVVVLRTHLFSSQELNSLQRGIAGWARENLPEDITARVTGSAVLLTEASDALAGSQASSLAIALAAIYLMMLGLFRSVSVALMALSPNLLPIVAYFGFLGWIGVSLDIVTSLIATAALGLAVDNAVHMIRRYQQCLAAGRDEGWVIWLTMLRTGKPMILANLMLIAAFLIFTLSSFVPVRTGGLLWAFTLAACLSANLIFLPVLLRFRMGRSGSEPAVVYEELKDAQRV